jgi:hypothetical protein
MVVRDRRRLTVAVLLEEEELGLDTGHHLVTERGGLARDALEREPRITLERTIVRMVDVADQPRDARFRIAPREDTERLQVRLEEHVAFLDADEPLDRGSVEEDLPVERFRELTGRHLHVLGLAQDVGERKSQEADVQCPAELEDACRFGVGSQILAVTGEAGLFSVLRRGLEHRFG